MCIRVLCVVRACVLCVRVLCVRVLCVRVLCVCACVCVCVFLCAHFVVICIFRLKKNSKCHFSTFLYSFYKKYGPVFSIKLGKYKVVVASSPVAVHEILVKRSGDYAGRRQSYAFQRSTLG